MIYDMTMHFLLSGALLLIIIVCICLLILILLNAKDIEKLKRMK